MERDQLAARAVLVDATAGQPWGSSARIAKAAALIAAHWSIFPEVRPDTSRFAGMCSAIMTAFSIDDEADCHLAMGAAVRLIACDAVSTEHPQ